MKKFFIISLLALLGMTQAAAQEYEYVPFVREGVKWICSNYYTLQQSHFTLELKGDAVINGVTYKAMHKYSGEEIDPNNDTIPVYMREEGKVVYAIVPDGKTYEECPIDCFGDSTINEDIMDGKEFVLYDFNDPEGFIMSKIPTMPTYIYHSGEIVDSLHDVMPQTIMLGDRSVKRYVFTCYSNGFCFIEGVGCDGLNRGYPLAYKKEYEYPIMHLDSVIEDGKIIYSSERFKESDYEIPEVAREGVQWVNERVVIENGDTTRSYYTYEFKGMDDRFNLLCHYYEGDSFDSEQDSVIAKMRGTIFELNRAISSQRCKRYAYYGDGDEPLCYIVEGIGFDSRDMGDLLTPFTRKPDPDADYQEYWGLSHVIKDGEIIYKGMCYKEPKAVAGDVNGDGRLTIADVTALIDILLGGGGTDGFNMPGDINMDNHLSIADVTTLIDMLLTQQ